MSEQQRYRVLKRLASGGMAEVFVAESAGIEGFRKQVAIKRVLPQLSKKEQFIAMFLDEARLSAHLSHGEVKIVDFGLAKASSQLAESDQGVIKGKFGYLAPETVMEKPVDQRVDVFAVGIILWEMLAGKRLFLGDTDFATVRLVRDAVIPSLPQINRQATNELDAIVKRALARDPDARYQTAHALGTDLTRYLFRYGVPVSDNDVAELVRSAMGGGSATVDGVKKIAEMIDLMLLEFRSLTKDDQDKEKAGPSLFPETLNFHSSEAPEDGGDGIGELGGLADELEGPEPVLEPVEESSSVASWFRGLIPR
jgi:serine/threonine-protein kinase